ncbi:MAG: transglutaminase domain-containing protein [Firmicutes bacterium]|nr:transglutaminase domain-containing protein [Bacillota bacterium]
MGKTQKSKIFVLAKAMSVLLLAVLLCGCGREGGAAGPDPTVAVAAAPAELTPTPAPTPDPDALLREQRLKEAQDGFWWDRGYLCAINADGSLKHDTYIGVLHFGEDGHYTSGDEKLDKLVADVIAKNTDSGMTRMEKLRAMYEYTRDNIKYVGFPNHELSIEPAHGPEGWMVEIATKALEEQAGNCYYFAAEFAALARGLGYQAYATGGVMSAMEDPHGWVRIVDENGDIWTCDPEMEYRLLDWQERTGGQEEVDDYFYRNQEELSLDTGLAYSQQVDPFKAEKEEAEKRAAGQTAPAAAAVPSATPEASAETVPAA